MFRLLSTILQAAVASKPRSYYGFRRRCRVVVVLVLVDGRGRRRRGRGSFHRRRCWLVVMFDLCLIVVAAVVVGSGSAGDGVVRGCLTIVSFLLSSS